MKLICKCGNIEDLKTNKPVENFEFINGEEGTVAIVCKKCNEVIENLGRYFIKVFKLVQTQTVIL